MPTIHSRIPDFVANSLSQNNLCQEKKYIERHCFRGEPFHSSQHLDQKWLLHVPTTVAAAGNVE
jgi:hypothetical protein